jgi:hypothetical protein
VIRTGPDGKSIEIDEVWNWKRLNRGFVYRAYQIGVSQYDLKKKINQSNQKEKMANQYTGGKWNVYDNQMDVLDKTRISTARSLIFEFRFRKF